MHRLWYRQPATTWVEALPIGNGRLGAMVFGDPHTETLALNEDTFWSGRPITGQHPDRRPHLAHMRGLLAQADYHAAEQYAEAHLTGRWTQSFLPLAALHITTSDTTATTAYSRELDLSTGSADTLYSTGTRSFRRQVYASLASDLIVVSYTALEPGTLSFSIALDSAYTQSQQVSADRITLHGAAPLHVEPDYVKTDTPFGGSGQGMRSCTIAHIHHHNGVISSDAQRITISNATHCVILVSAATSFVSATHAPDADAHARAQASLQRYAHATDFAAHCAAHGALYHRSALTLTPVRNDLPTDERLRRLHGSAAHTLDQTVRYHGHAASLHPVDAPTDDVGLLALLYNTGRYLLIASSQPGTQAANLQGIWNDNPRPAWSSNYTININTQMNYWAALTGNLRECQQPLTDLIEKLAVDGARTASAYGCRGWTAHHNTDIWGPANPVKGKAVWFLWPFSGAWLALHLYEEFLFHGDTSQARTRFLPLLRGAAEFLLDWLQPQPDGTLQTSPSTSAENLFLAPDGRPCAVSIGSEADIAMTRALWRACLDLAQRLDIDEPWLAEIRAALPRLPEPQIGADGRLQEWRHQPADHEPGHRHISHVYGLYPSAEITPRTTPALAAAARQTLAQRLAHGGGHTGWSAAWVAACYARLGDGDAALGVLLRLLRDSTYPSMLGAHPPFQIDGSLGAPAAILELVAQSHGGIVALFPALPAAWQSGSLTGMRLRGGLTLDAVWDGDRASFTLTADQPCQVVISAPWPLVDDATGDVIPAEEQRRVDGVLVVRRRLITNEQLTIRNEGSISTC